MEEIKSFIPRKDKSSESEKKEQGGLSDSSSEELNFQRYLEGLCYTLNNDIYNNLFCIF